MPLPRHSSIGSILPFLLGGAMPPMTSPPIAGTPVRPPLGTVGSPTGAAGPLSGMQPPTSPFPSLAQRPDAPNLGGVLTDPLPDLRLEPMPQPNLAAMSQPFGGVDPLAPKPKLDKGRLIGGIFGALSDGLMAYGGLQPTFGPAMLRREEGEMEDRRWRDKLAAELAAKRQERLDPRLEQVGNTVGWLDPAARSYNPIFTAPSPAEQYAAARGFTPGTPEYRAEVETYRLGSWSDPALDAKESLESTRYGYRDRLQDDRLATSRRNTDVRAGVTRRGQDIRSGDTRRGQDVTDRRVRGSAGYQGRGDKGGGARAMLNGRSIVVRGGKWVDEATGQPVN